jgi:hypothetical protein
MLDCIFKGTMPRAFRFFFFSSSKNFYFPNRHLYKCYGSSSNILELFAIENGLPAFSTLDICDSSIYSSLGSRGYSVIHRPRSRTKLFYMSMETRRSCFMKHRVINAPHSQSGVVPMSSLSGVGQLGFWEFGTGGTIGEGWGK